MFAPICSTYILRFFFVVVSYIGRIYKLNISGGKKLDLRMFSKKTRINLWARLTKIAPHSNESAFDVSLILQCCCFSAYMPAKLLHNLFIWALISLFQCWRKTVPNIQIIYKKNDMRKKTRTHIQDIGRFRHQKPLRNVYTSYDLLFRERIVCLKFLFWRKNTYDKIYELIFYWQIVIA